MTITKNDLVRLIRNTMDEHNTEYKADLEEKILEIGQKSLENDPRFKELMKPLPNKLLGTFAGDSADKSINQPGLNKSYKEIFNIKDSFEGSEFSDFEDLLKALKGNRDPRLKSLHTGEGGSGGFLLPEQFEQILIDGAIENEIVRPRARVYGLGKGKGNSLKIPAYADDDHNASGIFGVEAKWTGEEAQKDETDPKFRALEMKVNKLVCFTKSSDELLEDSGIPLTDTIGRAFIESIGFYSDLAYLRGTGSGQPLGVLNSNALITVDGETDQDASTIVYENIVNMFAKLMPASFKTAVWVASISTIPQLLKLGIKIGTAGVLVNVLKEESGRFFMLGKEILFTEKVPALGSAGCIGLYDFSKYAILMKQAIKLESSIHPDFRTDKTNWRSILRVDGQPILNSELTCLDGTTTVSPFVTLNAIA